MRHSDNRPFALLPKMTGPAPPYATATTANATPGHSHHRLPCLNAALTKHAAEKSAKIPASRSITRSPFAPSSIRHLPSSCSASLDRHFIADADFQIIPGRAVAHRDLQQAAGADEGQRFSRRDVPVRWLELPDGSAVP